MTITLREEAKENWMKRRVVYLLGLALCLYAGPAAAWAPPFTQFTVHTGTALEESDNRYAFLVAPNGDLFVIKKSQTGTHRTEVHVLSAATSYRSFTLHTGTPLPESDDRYAFALATNRDLFILKKSNTGTHSTEIHVLSAASNYQNFIVQTGTPLEESDARYGFALASNRDLFIFKKSNTGTHTTEIHVLSADSKYKNFSVHTGTALEETDGRWDFALAPNRDLVAIKKSNTGTGSTEIHVLSAASNYRSFSVHTGTPLEETDDRYAFAMPATGPSSTKWSQLAGNNLPDLFVVKKSNTGTHSTEVHVLTAASRGGVPSIFPVNHEERHIRFDQPPVNQPRTAFPEIRFQEGDRVLVTSAGGCVQTGGFGKTWKRYVDPEGDNSDHLYRGQIRIPTVTQDLETIQGYKARQGGAKNVGKPPAGVDPAQLHLELGYQDDPGGYGNNGYDNRDSGNGCDRLPDAWVELAVTHPPPEATQLAGPVLPMDVWWNEVDDNLLPQNPMWGAQVKSFPGVAPLGPPDPGGLCNGFKNEDDALDLGPHCTTARPDVDEPSFWDNAAYYSACHTTGGGGVVAGHINWGLATFQGRIYFTKHDLPFPQGSANPFSGDNGDDDYNMELLRTDEAATTLGNGVYSGTPWFPGSEPYRNKRLLDIEFDSDETVDIFDRSQAGWWKDFHRAVDAGRGHAELDGAEATLIGVLGIDNLHGAHAELHPILGFAAKVPPSSISPDTGDDHWVFFARRQGDEGGCSQALHSFGQDRMSFLLAIPADAQIHDARFDSFPTGMKWDDRPLPDGRLITFQLPPPGPSERSGILWGEFWVHSPSAPRVPARVPPTLARAGLLAKPAPEPGETMAALGSKLTASQQTTFQTRLQALENQARASRPEPVVAAGVRASLGAAPRHHALGPNEPRTLPRTPQQRNPERAAANARRMQALSEALGGTKQATDYLRTIARVPRSPRNPDGELPDRPPGRRDDGRPVPRNPDGELPDRPPPDRRRPVRTTPP